ncbi:MAG: UDP-N-acetylglucosamine 2-epimerase (non-hydrolyzing) [Thermoleophilaceae bacterium]
MSALDPAATPRVMVCFGTRPEAIKVAPVIDALRACDALDAITVTTAQHREMLDQMLASFEIVPDLDLGLMRPRQDLAQLTARAVAALGEVMAKHMPDAVLVQGDTTTAFCAALAAFYAGIPVGHVEAGLRTKNPRDPFPEEINRRLVAPLARWHFCPTERSADNLLAEGAGRDEVLVTGNTVIDALFATAERPLTESQERRLPAKRAARRILVTLHRRETQGAAQRELCRMLARVASRPDVEVVFPVHMSPAVRESVETELGGLDSVHLTEPLDYPTFVHALRTADLVVTDSGGIQEEAPSFGVPVLVMRETTERPEGVSAGCVRLSGTDPLAVERDIVRLLDTPEAYRRMSQAANPYGDGRAAQRIVARLRRDLVMSSPEAIPDGAVGTALAAVS